MKKKILFIELVQSGGPPTRLSDILTNLSDKYEPIVVCSPGSILISKCKNLMISCHVIPATDLAEIRIRPFLTMRRYLKNLLVLLLLSIKHRVGLIYSNHYLWSIYANPIAFILGLPAIVHLRDIWPLEPKIARILMKFYKKTTFVAISKHVRRLFVNKYNLNSKRIITIYDGVDSRIFSGLDRASISRKFENRSKTVLMISRVEPERNLEIFVDTAAHVLERKKNIKFIHYGLRKGDYDAEYYKLLKRRVEYLGLKNVVTFEPYINQDYKLARIFHKSFLLLVPAEKFALPNVAIESSMSSTPVIAFNTGGNPEVIQNNINGKLLETNSPILYGKAIIKYLNDRILYTKTSINSPRAVHNKFSTPKNIEKIYKLIDSKL